MHRRSWALPMVAMSVVVLAAPAAAQSPGASGGAPPPMALPDGWSMVVGGLDSPRGLAVAADGTIYVAESGEGGTDPCVDHPELVRLCFGTTGGVSQVKDGTATRIVDGVMSAITDTGETFGVSAVAVGGDGTIWYTVGGPAAGAADTRAKVPGGEGIGQLYKLGADGTSTSVADFAAFESASNPDKDQPGNELPDSNINGLAITKDGTVLVADAGGNDLLSVGADGAINFVAGFLVEFQPLPPDPTASMDPNASPAMVPMDPVPTSVAVGPDGAYYVGLLTGFPFPPGGAAVYKVVPGQDPVVYADGFTNVMGVAFAEDGTLYVLEISHDGLLATPPGQLPMGGLWSVPPGGGTPELLATGLPMPGGIAVGPDGTIYASICAVCPNGGGIVSLSAAG